MRAAPRTGTWVGPKVQLVRQLAVGTSSTVWLARHRDYREPVAVKLLDVRLHRKMGNEVVRFHREAKALEQLRSAHSVRLLEHGLTRDEQPYLVMELLRGQTLGARLRREHRLPLSEVTRLVQQLTAALGEAHELGMVHRDVTAENVFLLCADQLVAKLVDFGMAKHMRSGRYAISTSDAIREAANTVAPEMLRIGGEVDQRADLWALGALAYHALTGIHPFAEPDYEQALRRMKAGDLAPLAAFDLGEMPATLDAFFAMALAPDPAARHDSAEDLAAAWMWAVGEEDSVELAPPNRSPVRLASDLEVTAVGSSPLVKRDDLAATLISADDPRREVGAPAPAAGVRADLAATRVVVDDEDDLVATRIRDTDVGVDLTSTLVSASDGDDEPGVAGEGVHREGEDTLVVTGAAPSPDLDDDDDDGGGTLIVTGAPADLDEDDDDEGGGTLIVIDPPVVDALEEEGDDDDEPLTRIRRDPDPPPMRTVAEAIPHSVATPAVPAPASALPVAEVPVLPSPEAPETVDEARDLRRVATLAAGLALLALVVATVAAMVLATP